MALTGLTNLQPLHIKTVGIGTFDNTVSIGGTLTYEDVTNVDAIGIITARSGINVSAGDLTINDKIVHAGDTNTTLRFPSADMITAETAGTERLRIQADGDVSFGDETTGRAQIKHVSGNQNSVNGGGFPQYAFVGNEGTGMRRASSNVLCFDTNGAERVRIENNGRIAIGNHTGADSDLHIKTATSPTVRLQDTTNDCILLSYAQDSNAHVGTYSNHDLIFDTNSLERVRIQSSGYTLVGDTNRRIFSSNNYPLFQVASSASSQWGRISSTSYTNDGVAGGFVAAKSRSTTIGSHTVVQNNDQLGLIAFEGSDGDEFVRGAEINAVVTGTPGNNDMPTRLDFNVTNDNSNNPTTRMSIRPDGYVELQNDTYLSIPRDEICISFDEGQKMITSNDGQGNFNLITGKNNDAVHVSSSSGNSGITQIEMNSDGTDGNIWLATGPTRVAGSSATFVNGIKVQYYASNSSSKFNGLQYVTGSSTSPSGLSGNYPFIHKGNAFDGTWTTDSTSQFKVLGDGGSIAITTNDGGGNCNVCFNHASEVPDTNGSSWRIRADIDAANSHFYIQNAKSVTSGQTTGMTSRFEIDENGNGYINGNSFSSDQRLKKNISNITGATDKIKALTGRTFEWKEELEFGEGTKYGFVAQELETVLPELVSKALVHFDKDGNIIHDNYTNKGEIVDTAKTINTVGVIPVLVEALKEAITRIETLETKVAALEGS
tara:strand:+ start:128 stop:2278 length:2151 start_codon:yes stop_codon:yes gene_type:complete